MICIDASVVIPWLAGERSPDLDRLDELVSKGLAYIAPVTITELFSDPRGAPILATRINGFRVMELKRGYWERTGAMRAELLRAGRKAPVADALIAQACIDAEIPLLTRDNDFKAYAKLFGLNLA